MSVSRSVSTCPPRGDLVDSLPCAPSHSFLAQIGGLDQPLVKESAPTHNDFFSSVGSVAKCDLVPFVDDFYSPLRFPPHQDVRQLALIEVLDIEYWVLPLQYGSPVAMVRRTRAEEQQREVWSEVVEDAFQRLLDYCCYSWKCLSQCSLS